LLVEPVETDKKLNQWHLEQPFDKLREELMLVELVETLKKRESRVSLKFSFLKHFDRLSERKVKT